MGHENSCFRCAAREGEERGKKREKKKVTWRDQRAIIAIKAIKKQKFDDLGGRKKNSLFIAINDQRSTINDHEEQRQYIQCAEEEFPR